MTPYEVTYSNVWPSEVLRDRIREHVVRLGERADLALVGCHAWFERGPRDQRLDVRIELSSSRRGTVETHRRLRAREGDGAVRAAIDSAFTDLAAELARAA